MVFGDAIQLFIDRLDSFGYDANIPVDVLDEDSALCVQVFRMRPRLGVQTFGMCPRLGVQHLQTAAGRCDLGRKICPQSIEITLQLRLH